MARNLSSILPSSVSVAFPIRRCGQPTSYAWPESYTKTINLADLSLAVAPDYPFVGHPGRKTFRSTALALYTTPAGPPTNQTTLDALARAIAQAYYDYASVDVPGDVVYGGITTQEPAALIDTIDWTYRDGDVSTRLRSPPLDGAEMREFQHWDSVASCTDDIPTLWTSKAPCIEVTEPLSLSGSNVRILRKKICLEAGRLVEVIEGIETTTCAPCGSPCTTQFCVDVQGCLNGQAGITVQVLQGTTVIATGVTAWTITALFLGDGGDGSYTDGTNYALSFTGGGGTGAAGLFDVSGGFVTNLRLTAGGTGYTSDPTVGFPGAGSGFGASATVQRSARACIAVPSAGTYTIKVNQAGWSVSSQDVTIIACVTNNVSVSLTPATGYHCCDSNVVPDTLFLTDSNTTVTLAWNGVSVWSGCYTVSKSNSVNGALCPATNIVVVAYDVQCGGGFFTATQRWQPNACTGSGTPVIQSWSGDPCATFTDQCGGGFTSACCASVSIPYTGGAINLSGTFPATHDCPQQFVSNAPLPAPGGFTLIQ